MTFASLEYVLSPGNTSCRFCCRGREQESCHLVVNVKVKYKKILTFREIISFYLMINTHILGQIISSTVGIYEEPLCCGSYSSICILKCLQPRWIRKMKALNELQQQKVLPSSCTCPSTLLCIYTWSLPHIFHLHGHGNSTTATHRLGSNSVVIHLKKNFIKGYCFASSISTYRHCWNQQFRSFIQTTAHRRKIG